MGLSPQIEDDSRPEYDEDQYERAKWMLCRTSNVGSIRLRMHECATMREIRGWVKAYNEVQDQLPPGKQDFIKDVQAHADNIREESAWSQHDLSEGEA